MTTLIEKVVLAAMGAADLGPLSTKQRKNFAQAVIVTVLREMLEPSHDMKQRGAVEMRRQLHQIYWEAIADPTWQAMLRAFAAEHGIELEEHHG